MFISKLELEKFREDFKEIRGILEKQLGVRKVRNPFGFMSCVKLEQPEPVSERVIKLEKRLDELMEFLKIEKRHDEAKTYLARKKK